MIVTFISWLMSVGAVILITFTLFAGYDVFDRFGEVEVSFNAKLFVKLLFHEERRIYGYTYDNSDDADLSGHPDHLRPHRLHGGVLL